MCLCVWFACVCVCVCVCVCSHFFLTHMSLHFFCQKEMPIVVGLFYERAIPFCVGLFYKRPYDLGNALIVILAFFAIIRIHVGLFC